MRIAKTHCCCGGEAPDPCADFDCFQEAYECCGTFRDITIPAEGAPGGFITTNVPFLSASISAGYMGGGTHRVIAGSGGTPTATLGFANNGPGGAWGTAPMISQRDPDGEWKFTASIYYGDWTVTKDGDGFGEISERVAYVNDNYASGSVISPDTLLNLRNPCADPDSPWGGIPNGCMSCDEDADACLCSCYGPHPEFGPCTVPVHTCDCPDEEGYCSGNIECMPVCYPPDTVAWPFKRGRLDIWFGKSCTGCGHYAKAQATYTYMSPDEHTKTISQEIEVIPCFNGCDAPCLDPLTNECGTVCPFGPANIGGPNYGGVGYGMVPQCCFDVAGLTLCEDFYASCDCHSTKVWGPYQDCPDYQGASNPCDTCVEYCDGIRWRSDCTVQGPIPVNYGNCNCPDFAPCPQPWCTGTILPG